MKDMRNCSVRGRFGHVYTLAIVLCGLAGVGAQDKDTAHTPAGELPTVFHYDFREPLPNDVHFQNLSVNQHAFEPEGLRFFIPKTFFLKRGSGVGIDTYFGLRGDFEITVAFDDFRADSPSSGPGVGFNLVIESKGGGAARIARVVRPGDDQVVRWDWYHNIKGKPAAGGTVPAPETAGRLRLKRAGQTLSFLWSAGMQSDNYQQLYECALGTYDIYFVRLNVGTFGLPVDVGVRLRDWLVRGHLEAEPAFDPAKAPEPEAGGGGAPVSDSAKGRVAAVLLIGLIITCSLALVAWVLVRKQRARNGVTNPGVEGVEEGR
jgi:hypothetical protein